MRERSGREKQKREEDEEEEAGKPNTSLKQRREVEFQETVVVLFLSEATQSVSQ